MTLGAVKEGSNRSCIFKLASGKVPLRRNAFAMVTGILKLSRGPEKSVQHIPIKLLECSGVNMRVKWHRNPNYPVNTN